MQIKQQVYYHIHRIGEWSSRWHINSVIFWGQKEINIFNKWFDEHMYITDLTNGNGRMYGHAALINFLKQPEDFQVQNYRSILDLTSRIIKEQSLYIRETIFEEVRANYFPQLPSRKTCIWVCTKEAAQNWWQIIEGDKKILKLELTGVLHKADQRHLINDTFSHNEFRAHAFNYWTGSDGLNPLQEELLFEGIIKVIDEYADIDNFIARENS